VDELTTEWQAKVPMSSYKVNRDAYLEMINGVIYGEDPRQGYVDGGVFYHPELKFSFPVPANWQLQNSPSQVQMAPESGKALMIFTLAEGSSLQDAASKVAADLKLTVLNNRQLTVNGLQALEVMSELVSQDPSTGEQTKISIKSVYIKYGSTIYVFHGVSASADIQSFSSVFDKSMFGFKELKDPSRLNVLPERIKVVSVNQTGSLASVLQSFGIPSARHKEMAVVNGMTLTATVSAGTKIKIFSKGTGTTP
jgi:predicted Zn-dependent protease